MDCPGFEFNEVSGCDHKDCSLYPYRMGTGNQNPAQRNRAIKEYCMWCMIDQVHEITLCTSVHCPLFNLKGGTRQETSYTSPQENDLNLSDTIPSLDSQISENTIILNYSK